MPVFLVAAGFAIMSTLSVLTGDLSPSPTGWLVVTVAYWYCIAYALRQVMHHARKEKSND